MNTIKLIILSAFCIVPCSFKAQESPYNQKIGAVIKTDILTAALAIPISQSQSYSLSIETFIKNKQSLQVSGYYTFFDYNRYSPNSKFRSFQIIPEYKLYLNKKKEHKGIYSGIYSGYVTMHELFPIDNSEHIQRFIKLGLSTGYQMYFSKHFVIDCLLGLGMNRNFYNKKNNDIEQFNVNVDQKIYIDGRCSINIGYVFY